MAEKNLSIKLSLNDKQFQSSLKKATRSMTKFGNNMKSIGTTLTTSITLPVLGLGVASAKLASDFEESLNKVNVAFGESSEIIQNFAKTTLNSFGIAEGSALEMASLFGDMATSMGLSQQEAANMSTSLVGLAGDLASFKNIGIEQAQTALAGIFTGETESLKRLGIVMTEANLKSYALSKGLEYSSTKMSQAQKVAMRYQFIIDSTANAQGDFARTSEGVANTTRSVTESLKELGVEVGVIILPLTEKLLEITKSIIDGFKGLSDENKKLVIQFASYAAILGPILIVLGSIAGSLATLIPLVISGAGAVGTFIASFGGLLLEGALFASGITAIADAMGYFNKEAKETEKIIGDFEPITDYVAPPPSSTPTGGTFERTSVPQRIEPIKVLNVELKKTKELFETMTPIVEEFDEQLSGMDIVANSITQSFETFGNTIQGVFAQALQSQDGFFKAFLEGSKQALASLLAQITAMLILNALLGGTGIGALMGFQNIGGLAGIGQVLGGVGNVNANSVGAGGGLKSMINTGGSTEVYGVISGADILLSSDRARNNRNRTRGY